MNEFFFHREIQSLDWMLTRSQHPQSTPPAHILGYCRRTVYFCRRILRKTTCPLQSTHSDLGLTVGYRRRIEITVHRETLRNITSPSGRFPLHSANQNLASSCSQWGVGEGQRCRQEAEGGEGGRCEGGGAHALHILHIYG